MADLADAVEWRHLEDLTVPVVGYVDGPVSAWPSEAFDVLGDRVVGLITVLADPRQSIFDSEAGDAGVDAVAAAVADRLAQRLHSTVYTNADNCPGQTRALRAKSIHWTDAAFWPEPGCYLWAAAPGTTPGRLPAWCPVSPVAVQDRYLGTHDLSTTFHGWPIVPVPAPPPTGGVDDVSPEDIQAVAKAVADQMRELYRPDQGELFGRAVQATITGIQKTGLDKQ